VDINWTERQCCQGQCSQNNQGNEEHEEHIEQATQRQGRFFEIWGGTKFWPVHPQQSDHQKGFI